MHSNVGLQHATMAMFNAWCDRMPMLVLGATGPVDAIKRRPWIDWIHTARDQGALVRDYTKWDDQPASPAAAREALLRGAWIANTAPQGPVYINLDAEMQEAKLAEPLPPIDAARYLPPIATAAPADLVAEAAAMLKAAKQVVILAGPRLAQRGRLERAHRARRSAQRPRRHRPEDRRELSRPIIRCMSARRVTLTPDSVPALRTADVILSLDWVDLAGALQRSGPLPSAKIIQVSLDHRIHNGWSMDYQALPPVDLFLSADPDLVVPDLVKALGAGGGRDAAPRAAPGQRRSGSRPASPTSTSRAPCARSLGDRPTTLTHSAALLGRTAGGRSATRSTFSAPMAAAASAAVRASRSARRWR